MSSSSTSNEPKPSSDSASDRDDNIVALTTAGLPIRVRPDVGDTPWTMPYGSWVIRARVG